MIKVKRKRATLVLKLLLLIISVLSIVFIYVFSETRPVSSQYKSVAFKIVNGESVSAIASNLEKNNIIRSSLAFKLFYYFGGRKELINGSYLLSPNMSIDSIIDLTSGGKTTKIKITLLEGKRANDLIKQLSIATNIDFDILKQEFITNTSSPIVNSRIDKNSIEGYIFPDTYIFDFNTSPQDIVTQIYNNTQDKLSGLNLSKSALSLNQILILASIVEKEASSTIDRKMVSQVFLNRLKIDMPLQSDVTVDYVTGHNITLPKDINIDSAFNTYKNKGLPPTPICSPGLTAIEAVISPTPNDYIFFLADKNGVVHYAKTLDIHNNNINMYLNN